MGPIGGNHERKASARIEAKAVMAFRDGFAVRSCEMEARSVPQHRTQVNLLAGRLAWVSGPGSVTPHIRSWPVDIGGGSGGTSLCLTPGDLERSKRRGERPHRLGRPVRRKRPQVDVFREVGSSHSSDEAG